MQPSVATCSDLDCVTHLPMCWLVGNVSQSSSNARKETPELTWSVPLGPAEVVPTPPLHMAPSSL